MLQNKKAVSFLTIVILILSLGGCSWNNNEEELKEEIPDSLQAVELTLEKTINNLEEIYDWWEKQKFEVDKDEEDENDKEDENNEANEDNENTQEEEIPLELWEETEEEIERLHQEWYRYEGESDVQTKKRESFEAGLDDLTEATSNQKLMDALINSSKVELSLARIYRENDLKEGRVRELAARARRVIYLTLAGKNKGIVENELKELEESIEVVSKELEDNKKQELSELVSGLKEAVSEEDIEAVKIKGNIIIQQAKEL